MKKNNGMFIEGIVMLFKWSYLLLGLYQRTKGILACWMNMALLVLDEWNSLTSSETDLQLQGS